jgi:hypothetical protein
MRYLPLICALFVGCAAVPQSGQSVSIPDTGIEDPQAGYQLWKEAGISSYRYSREPISAWCPGPAVQVTVRNSRVQATDYLRDYTNCYDHSRRERGQDVRRDFPILAATVDDLFSEMLESRDGCRFEGGSFHPIYGFPLSAVRCGTLDNGTEIEDARHGYRIVKFEILQ